MTRPVTNFTAREKSRWLGLAALLAFYPGQLAVVPAAGCPTVGACIGGNPSFMVVGQQLGLLAATPAQAQEGTPLELRNL